MKIERWECDGCHAISNGDIGDWYSVRINGGVVEVMRLRPKNIGTDNHVCGMSCAMSLVAEAMLGLPK
jgi:hypothetical protein